MKNRFFVEVHLITSETTKKRIVRDQTNNYVRTDDINEEVSMKRVFLHVVANDKNDLVQHERVMIDFTRDSHSVSVLTDHVNKTVRVSHSTRFPIYSKTEMLDEPEFVKQYNLTSKKELREFLCKRFDKTQRDELMRLVYLCSKSKSELTKDEASDKKIATKEEKIQYKKIDLREKN